MMKKITAILICAVLLAAMLPFGVSAADSASFKVRLAEQTDKTATVVVEFAGGTGFSALDLSIKYNTLKLTLQTAKIGSGYSTFKAKAEDAGAFCVSMINPKGNPIKVSMANTDPFAAVGGDNILVRMTFSKIGGTKLSESDVQLTFENCQTSKFTDITTAVSYDLDAPTVDEEQTAYAQQTSMDGITDNDDSEIGEPVEDNGQTTSQQSGSAAAQSETAGVSGAQNDGAAAEKPASAKEEATTSNNTKTIAVVVICIVLVAGIALGASMIVKNKKKSESEF